MKKTTIYIIFFALVVTLSMNYINNYDEWNTADTNPVISNCYNFDDEYIIDMNNADCMTVAVISVNVSFYSRYPYNDKMFM